MVFKMAAADEISRQLAMSAANSASNAMGFQVTRLVDMGVNGFLNLLFSQSKEDKIKENEEHTNRLLDIVNTNKPAMRQPQMRLSPRESIEKDIRESNDHINTAIVELGRAREKSKCGVCKHTLDETIDLVSEKTGEILDVSEKVLALQRLKETGEIPSHLSWYDLTKAQKKIVADTVEIYKPMVSQQEREEFMNDKGDQKVISVRRVQDGKTKKQPRKAPRKAGTKRKTK
jgi:hypothetical protein